MLPDILMIQKSLEFFKIQKVLFPQCLWYSDEVQKNHVPARIEQRYPKDNVFLSDGAFFGHLKDAIF